MLPDEIYTDTKVVPEVAASLEVVKAEKSNLLNVIAALLLTLLFVINPTVTAEDVEFYYKTA